MTHVSRETILGHTEFCQPVFKGALHPRSDVCLWRVQPSLSYRSHAIREPPSPFLQQSTIHSHSKKIATSVVAELKGKKNHHTQEPPHCCRFDTDPWVMELKLPGPVEVVTYCLPPSSKHPLSLSCCHMHRPHSINFWFPVFVSVMHEKTVQIFGIDGRKILLTFATYTVHLCAGSTWTALPHRKNCRSVRRKT